MDGISFHSNMNPRMERVAHFEANSKLKVNVCFENYGEHLPLLDAANGHRLLLYYLVDRVLLRANRLSSLTVNCSYYFIDGRNVPFHPYCLKGTSAETVVDDEPSTIEQYTLEPLANLKTAIDDFSFVNLPAGCKQFLSRRMEIIEQFKCDRQLQNDMVSKHQLMEEREVGAEDETGSADRSLAEVVDHVHIKFMWLQWCFQELMAAFKGCTQQCARRFALTAKYKRASKSTLLNKLYVIITPKTQKNISSTSQSVYASPEHPPKTARTPFDTVPLDPHISHAHSPPQPPTCSPELYSAAPSTHSSAPSWTSTAPESTLGL